MEAAQPQDKLRRTEPHLLSERLRLPAAHESLVGDGEAPTALLARLVEIGLLVEATRLLAYALPEREAVWWACVCVAHTAGAELSAEERRALEAAEAWVRRPDERTAREAAWAAAEAGLGKPGAWPALAAYWSRPSVPLDAQGGRGVETAIARAAARGGSARQPERLRRFIDSGRDIAAGGVGRLPPEAAETEGERP